MHNNLPSQFCAVEEDGFYEYTIGRRYIGPDTKLLEGLARNVAQVVTGLVPDTTLSLSASHLCLTRELSSIPLHTFYRPTVDTEGVATLVPVFSSPGAEMNMTWTPPAGMRLFLVAAWAKDRMTRNIPQCYLVARDPERRTSLLPLPNLYEDGRICLGNFDSSAEILRPTVFETFNRAIEIFNSSKWNTDLLDARRITNSKHLFRFTPEGEVVPPATDWSGLVQRTNNTVYQFIAEVA